jgi:hypothetical protein
LFGSGWGSSSRMRHQRAAAGWSSGSGALAAAVGVGGHEARAMLPL